MLHSLQIIIKHFIILLSGWMQSLEVETDMDQVVVVEAVEAWEEGVDLEVVAGEVVPTALTMSVELDILYTWEDFLSLLMNRYVRVQHHV